MSLSKFKHYLQLLPARYQTKVVFCSWFLREYAAHAPVRRLTRPSVTCNSDAPYQPRPWSLCVLCPATPLLLPRPLQSCTHRRTFENSHWLYCSPAEQPDCTCYLSNKSFLCYQMLRMQCTAANLFGIKIYLLSLISNRAPALFRQAETNRVPPLFRQACGAYLAS